MSKQDILNSLEKNIHEALKLIAEQHRTINALKRERKEFHKKLVEQDKKTAFLEKELEQKNIQLQTNDVSRYQQREKMLKDRIHTLLEKIEKVDTFK